MITRSKFMAAMEAVGEVHPVVDRSSNQPYTVAWAEADPTVRSVQTLTHGRRQRGGRPYTLPPALPPSRREKKLYVPSRPFPSIVTA